MKYNEIDGYTFNVWNSKTETYENVEVSFLVECKVVGLGTGNLSMNGNMDVYAFILESTDGRKLYAGLPMKSGRFGLSFAWCQEPNAEEFEEFISANWPKREKLLRKKNNEISIFS